MNRMGASRLQQAGDILGVAVPFFFEGAVGGTLFTPDRNTPSPAYIDDFVTTSDGLRLAKAFIASRPALQRRIVALVNEVGGEE